MPSGELTHRALVEHASATRLPLLISTGMATLEEAREALGWAAAARASCDGLVLMHCTSAYPASDDALNLTAIPSMARELGVPIGYSDHSLGGEAAVAAAALGAVAIEKHLTLDRTMPGPDHSASLEPAAFADMVRSIRRVEAMRGDGVKAPRPEERDAARVARRSVVAAVDIAAGASVSPDMLACRRPATGIPPAQQDLLVGRRPRVALAAGTVLQWDQFEP